MEKANEELKKFAKKFVKIGTKLLVTVLLPVAVIIVLLAAATYFITIDDGTYKEDDWSSTPYAAGQYTNSVSVNRDGTLSSGTSTQDLWDKMLANGSRVDEYLDSPEELARLMRAEIVTQYPDTRNNPDEDINWEDIVNSDTLQGIIKFKRADSDGNTSTMSYVDPETFQSYIDEYNSSGSETAKQNALKHFTLRKSSTSTSSSSIDNDGNAVDESKLYFIGDSWIVGLQNSGIARTSYFYGKVGKHANSPEMAISAIPEKNDASAIILYLGVNGPNTYNKMNSLIDELANKYIDKPIYVLEVSPVNPDKYSGSVTNEQIHNYNEKVKEHCDNKENVQFLEVASTVTDNAGKLTNTTDGLHLNSYQDWYDSIISKITGNSVNSSSSPTGTGQAEIESCNIDDGGYTSIFTSGTTGRQFKEYRQNISGWDSVYVINDLPLSTRGWKSECGLVSLMILGSGYTEQATFADATNKMQANGGGTDICSWLGEYTGQNISFTNYDRDDIVDKLSNGCVAIIHSNDTSGRVSSSGTHFMTLLDISDDKSQVYLSNPWNGSSDQGWVPISTLDELSLYEVAYVTNDGSGVAYSNGGTTSTTNTAVVATWKQVDTKVTTDDPNVQEKDDKQYRMTTTNVNYQEMVEPYTMPFDMLWALLVEGEDKDFIFELADLIYGSDIQITVYDNLTVNTDVDDWHYTQRKKAVVNATITATCNGESETGRITNDEHDPHSETNYQTTKKVVTQTNTVNAVLTRANVWIVDYQNDYTYAAATETPGTPSTVTKPDENYPSSPNSTGNSYSCQEINNEKDRLKSIVTERAQRNNASSTASSRPTYRDYTVDFNENINVKYYNKYINITDNVTNTVSTQKYIQGTPSVKEKTDKNSTEDNFVTIFNKSKYRKNKSNILNTTSWLFEIIENNDSTTDMLDLIKYLLYKATGNDYGVTEFDFSIFDASKFQSINGVNGTSLLSEFLKCWENGPLRDYLIGNADYNSSPYIYKCITQDKQNYIMCDDLFTGNNNKNFGFGVCFWVNYAQSWNNVGYFREEGINITDAKYQTYGVSTLSVEIVDRVKEKIIEDKRQEVRNTANAKGITLTDYQVDALAALRYQGWYISDFLDAYKTYGMDSRIRSYSTGMGTSTARYNANWELFSTGKYKDQYGNEIVLSSSLSGGGSILESAEKIHTYMEQNNYFYCLDGRLKDTFEESKSSKGVCCATFVAWVLRDAGLINQTSHSAPGLARLLENTYNWTRVSGSQLQAGDVMVYNYGHVEIYAGNGTIYNAGSDSAIKNAAPSRQWNTPDYGLRAP